MNDTGNDHDPKAPNPNGANEPTTEIPIPDQELARLQNERNQLEQQLQRQLADAANMRRRARQEMDDQKRRVVEGIAQDREILAAGLRDDEALALAIEEFDSELQLQGFDLVAHRARAQR